MKLPIPSTAVSNAIFVAFLAVSPVVHAAAKYEVPDFTSFIRRTNAPAATGIPTMTPKSATSLTFSRAIYTLGKNATNFIVDKWVPTIAKNYLALSGVENFTITSRVGLVNAFGIWVYEPFGTGYTDSTFYLVFKRGATTVHTLSINPSNNVEQFISVILPNKLQFDSVSFLESPSTIDNDFFGECYLANVASDGLTNSTAFTNYYDHPYHYADNGVDVEVLLNTRICRLENVLSGSGAPTFRVSQVDPNTGVLKGQPYELAVPAPPSRDRVKALKMVVDKFGDIIVVFSYNRGTSGEVDTFRLAKLRPTTLGFTQIFVTNGSGENFPAIDLKIDDAGDIFVTTSFFNNRYTLNYVDWAQVYKFSGLDGSRLVIERPTYPTNYGGRFPVMVPDYSRSRLIVGGYAGAMPTTSSYPRIQSNKDFSIQILDIHTLKPLKNAGYDLSGNRSDDELVDLTVDEGTGDIIAVMKTISRKTYVMWYSSEFVEQRRFLMDYITEPTIDSFIPLRVVRLANGDAVVVGTCVVKGRKDTDLRAVCLTPSGQYVTRRWDRIVDGIVVGADQTLTEAALDFGGNLFMTGTSRGPDASMDIYTAKVLTANGAVRWTSSFAGRKIGDDWPSALINTKAGHVYVIGTTGNPSYSASDSVLLKLFDFLGAN